jgi:hypothetical protein
MPRTINTAVSTPEAIVPSAYTIESIMLENHAGRSIDINGVVTDFVVSESIYRSSVTISLNVRDTNNLLEEFEINGQEKITVTLSRQDFESNEKKTVKHLFYITEYPVYSRNLNHLQVYSMKGISEHAFLSKFKRISRAMSGSALELVKTILSEDLKIDDSLIELGSSRIKSHNLNVIVPNLAPLDAVAWILRRTFDQYGAPYYCFEKFGGGIRIVSQTELVSSSNEIHREYTDGKFYSQAQQTAKDYKERLSRIINLTSNLKLSKYVAGAAGAFASTTRYIDLAKKTYFEETFDYDKEFAAMSWIDTAGFKTLDADFKIGSEPQGLNKQATVYYNDVVLDGTAIDSYHAQSKGNSLARSNAHIENLDTIVHDIVISGDLDLNAGKAIGLKLVKPIDPQVEVKNAESSKNTNYDSMLSGKHLVVSTVHRFDKDYSLEIRVKRDSLNQELS